MQKNRCAFPRRITTVLPLYVSYMLTEPLPQHQNGNSANVLLSSGMPVKFPVNNMCFQWLSPWTAAWSLLWGNQITYTEDLGMCCNWYSNQVIYCNQNENTKTWICWSTFKFLPTKGYTTNYNARWLLKLKEKKRPPKSNPLTAIEADKTRKGRICAIVLFYLNINFTSELPKQCLIPIWKIAIGIFSILFWSLWKESGKMAWWGGIMLKSTQSLFPMGFQATKSPNMLLLLIKAE